MFPWHGRASRVDPRGWTLTSLVYTNLRRSQGRGRFRLSTCGGTLSHRSFQREGFEGRGSHIRDFSFAPSAPFAFFALIDLALRLALRDHSLHDSVGERRL